MAAQEDYTHPELLVKIATQESGMRAEAIGNNYDKNGNIWSRDHGWYQYNDVYNKAVVESGCATDLECSTKTTIAKLESMNNVACPYWSSQCKKDYVTIAK